MTTSYVFHGELWHYPGPAGWQFITLPADLAEQLRVETAPFRKGFGSVRVLARIAETRWSTSLFPDSKSNSYLLPVKKHIRTAAGIQAGDDVEVEIQLAFDYESD